MTRPAFPAASKVILPPFEATMLRLVERQTLAMERLAEYHQRQTRALEEIERIMTRINNRIGSI